jgi:hypothetical protein
MKTFSKTYPNIVTWTELYGWIEIGDDGNTDAFIRALDEGGTVWESTTRPTSFDEALQELEDALGKVIAEIGG